MPRPNKSFDDFSKDIPNLQIKWSANSLGTFKECPRKYFYQKILGLRAKRKSVHLKFGGYYAEAIEEYYKVKAVSANCHETALIAATRKALSFGSRDEAGVFSPWDLGEDHKDADKKNRATLVRAVVWYLEHFRNDPAETIILANGKPAVELEFNLGVGVEAPDGNEYQLSGFIDRVAQFGADRFIVDQKTTKTTLSDHYFKQYDPHNQMTLYTVAGNVVFGADVKGVIIDAVQLAVGFARFARGITYRTKGRMEEWLADTMRHLRRAEVCAQEQYWPQNDTACDKFGGCAFRSICGADPGVRELYLKTDFEPRALEPAEEETES